MDIRTRIPILIVPMLLACSASDTGGRESLSTSESALIPSAVLPSGLRPDREAFPAHPLPFQSALAPDRLAAVRAAGGIEKSLASLIAVNDCGSLLEPFRQEALAAFEQKLKQNLEQALMLAKYGCWDLLYACDDDSDGISGGGLPGLPDGAKDYTTTNTQVAGVDEADFVKNDGNWIYVLATGKLHVIDAWPPGQTHEVAAIPIQGTPKRMYLVGDRLVVYASQGPLTQEADPWAYYGYYGYYGGSSAKECTYGYDCDFTGDGNALRMTVFDISDKTAPKVLRTTDFSGSYLNSRRIGGNVYTVVVFPKRAIGGVVAWPKELLNVWDLCKGDKFLYDEDQIKAMFAKLHEDGLAAIAKTTLADFLPGVTDTRWLNGQPVTETGLLGGCKNYYLSQDGDSFGLLSLWSYDATQLGPLASTTVVGKPGAVYASSDALYVAVRHGGQAYFGDKIPDATTVHKFHLLPGTIATAYAGSGVVKGRILNQFSMDEFEGHLRLATTTGHLPSPNVHSTISVLGPVPGGLDVKGMVDGLAPSEDIRSARFNGPLGFVVTFKKTDPLFVIDLADPLAPKVKGELKIPGFSTYMHVLDDQHLLSIGYDADDKGSFAWFQGVMLQVFDVSDLAAPKLVHKHVIGTRGSTSDATTDHLAFTYFGAKQLLAIPMAVCEGGSGGTYGSKMTFSGLMVFRVTLDKGFEYLGGVSHEPPESAFSYGSKCHNWWTQSNSKVKRSVFLDEWVYSIAPDLMKVSFVPDVENPIAAVGF
jgi:hypothetical protein